MKVRILCSLLMILVSTTAVLGDTVMLFTREIETSQFFELAGIDYAAAVEDGVMDVFFEAGHIIFNFGLPGEQNADLPFRAEHIAVRTAKAGGASFLIEIGLSDPVESKPAPERVFFRYLDVIREETLAEGFVDLADIDSDVITDPRELCELVGRAAAMAALTQRGG